MSMHIVLVSYERHDAANPELPVLAVSATYHRLPGRSPISREGQVRKLENFYINSDFIFDNGFRRISPS